MRYTDTLTITPASGHVVYCPACCIYEGYLYVAYIDHDTVADIMSIILKRCNATSMEVLTTATLLSDTPFVIEGIETTELNIMGHGGSLYLAYTYYTAGYKIYCAKINLGTMAISSTLLTYSPGDLNRYLPNGLTVEGGYLIVSQSTPTYDRTMYGARVIDLTTFTLGDSCLTPQGNYSWHLYAEYSYRYNFPVLGGGAMVDLVTPSFWVTNIIFNGDYIYGIQLYGHAFSGVYRVNIADPDVPVLDTTYHADLPTLSSWPTVSSWNDDGDIYYTLNNATLEAGTGWIIGGDLIPGYPVSATMGEPLTLVMAGTALGTLYTHSLAYYTDDRGKQFLYVALRGYTAPSTSRIEFRRIATDTLTSVTTNACSIVASGRIEGFISRLKTKRITGAYEVSGIPSVVLAALLAKHPDYPTYIGLGGVDASLDVLTIDRRFENCSIFDAVFQVQAITGGYMSMRVDSTNPSRHLLYLEASKDSGGKRFIAGLNLKKLKRNQSFDKLCTKLIVLGEGEGSEQLKLSTDVTRWPTTGTYGDLYAEQDGAWDYIYLANYRPYTCFFGWTGEGDPLPDYARPGYTPPVSDTCWAVFCNFVDDTANWVQGANEQVIKRPTRGVGDYQVYIVFVMANYLLALTESADPPAGYGVIEGDPYISPTASDSATLAQEGAKVLDARKTVAIAYDLDVIDRSAFGANFEWERVAIGERVTAYDERLSATIDEDVVGISVSDLRKPHEMEIELVNHTANFLDTMTAIERALYEQSSKTTKGVHYWEDTKFDVLLGVVINFYVSTDIVRVSEAKLSWKQDAAPARTVTVDGNIVASVASMDEYDILKYLNITNGFVDSGWHTLQFSGGGGAPNIVGIISLGVYKRSLPVET